MSLGQDLAPHLPFLRRYARALTGTQKHGDAYVRQALEAIVAAPQDFRWGKKDGALLGDSCRTDKDKEIRAALFPADLAMPAGCSIKGSFAIRARVTGKVGVYNLRGCRSYPALTKPDRWFCSEADAQAAGFRRAYNCRGTM